jgi:pimeloyl-ACP methyl ester carboxylesterase
MVTQIFRFSIFIIVVTAMLVILTPVLTVNSLLFPLKIDSVYVEQQQIAHSKLLQKEGEDTSAIFILSPSQLQVPYNDFAYFLNDSVIINGWLVVDSTKKQAPLLLIIPDLLEGAISYLPAMQQFYDRGFNICLIDMPGQGRSGGLFYDFSSVAAIDLKQIILELKKNTFINKIAVMGNRTGAAIALTALNDSSGLADVLILQNPIVSMNSFFMQQATDEWGPVILPIMPALKRAYEQQTGTAMHHYNYKTMISKLYVPHMIVTANYTSQKNIEDALVLYHASNYYRKRLFLDKSSFNIPTGFGNKKMYYDKISAFINSSLPSNSKKNRFRKLVLL